jgi:hypothetical protein
MLSINNLGELVERVDAGLSRPLLEGGIYLSYITVII